ncbi:MAG: type II toxin-antitoxin system VapC family toxin [Anaerolineae bacterium]
MPVFVDTSALYAVLDADDDNHVPAAAKWQQLVTEQVPLVCSNYVVVETFALLQHRLGMAAAQRFDQDMSPLLRVAWVDEATHNAAVVALLIAHRRNLSLVDCTSFEIMRRLGIKEAFAFDGHFQKQGFITF